MLFGTTMVSCLHQSTISEYVTSVVIISLHGGTWITSPHITTIIISFVGEQKLISHTG